MQGEPRSLRTVFFGTPAFAVPSLDALLASRHHVVEVVTQPDRPRGRGLRVVPALVKARAVERGVPVSQPTSLRDARWLAHFAELAPDIAVVAAYGRLLPQSLLDLPRLGFVNVHASLLPRWRGAAPVHRAVLAGDRETGVTIMQVVLELDAGPILLRQSVPIGPDATSAQLEAVLASTGGQLLVEALDRLVEGRLAPRAQDASAVTYAKKLERRDSQIDWRRSALDIHNQIRGLQPWPLAACVIGGRRVALLRSRVENELVAGFTDFEKPATSSGTILEARGDALVVACGEGALRLLEVQPEGRRPMDARAFLNGTTLAPGDVIGPLPMAP